MFDFCILRWSSFLLNKIYLEFSQYLLSFWHPSPHSQFWHPPFILTPLIISDIYQFYQYSLYQNSLYQNYVLQINQKEFASRLKQHSTIQELSRKPNSMFNTSSLDVSVVI